MYNMKTEILILLLAIAVVHGATKKKSTEEATPTPSESDTTPPGPAILAIEIIDGNDTASDVRNTTKRTIESALGYGFQSNYFPTSQGKKYMVYPYSQQDIPPATGKDVNKYQSSHTLNIQKSVSYNLGTKIEPAAHSKQIFQSTQAPVYQPSAEGGYYPSTLYSTVGQGGIIGGLSTHIPQQQSSAATTIPVIILRVYTNQLADPSALYPNLPQTNPYATNLNNINLQSIISNYLQQQMYQAAQQMYKQPVYQTPSTVDYQGHGQNTVYSTQNPTYSLYSQGGYQTAQQPQIDYKSLEQAAATLPTHENYPSKSHTRVIYHGPKGHIQGVSYSGSSASSQQYGVPQQAQYTQSQSYSQAQPSYSQTQQSYSQSQPSYSQSQPSYSQSQAQSYAPTSQNSQNVYTDSNGQNYIYVYPSQLQGQGQDYYQQDYQQQEYQPQQEYQTQQDYQQQVYQQEQQQQEYEPQQEYQQAYQKPQEDRRYLPVEQASTEKVYNYHADSSKERSKKSSGGPITFESQKTETKSKA